jgi:hypothetical protein
MRSEGVFDVAAQQEGAFLFRKRVRADRVQNFDPNFRGLGQQVAIRCDLFRPLDTKWNHGQIILRRNPERPRPKSLQASVT